MNTAYVAAFAVTFKTLILWQQLLLLTTI